ncbi:molybdopterin-dependent oxidoreductase, partial [Pelagibacteraceae bacterium]|nr:molybdopterin-dependent oxidoreductase [Pelagibacteraceae bacterium]
FDKLKDNKFDLIYLLSSDNIQINKKDEFIIYQGSHGDRGAEIADIILPSPCYTEQNGLYINVEGRVQECRKASYPTGESKEDWKIFNLINKKLNNSNLFKDHEELRNCTIKELNNFTGIDLLPEKKVTQNIYKKNLNFIEEDLVIKKIDYYYTNAISRSSKTMSDCRAVHLENFKKNGTGY